MQAYTSCPAQHDLTAYRGMFTIAKLNLSHFYSRCAKKELGILRGLWLKSIVVFGLCMKLQLSSFYTYKKAKSKGKSCIWILI